ncbi:23S rRNA (adenine(2503)-C(2))-methyltransferase RlmN [Corallococcus exiguus]|uniref:Probable dual-specificity RNA methyltransferase RlmN n=1 Tax=Corallococcus exiguus TaxID=83462 RepID=A0A7Y1S2D7_9BACT|nr:MULTISPECIES: 23S rRNA (adenine(2503)-C(2))-methyltransferase RlmN [Corallococcus]NBC40191.1 23S rRNA (adenine(2503)-C(2))-methyltransferase RlmN [Corallococcus exiguus]NNB87538.1 23S rRNA (adenine(2503)-C(2))-methyltransferase RlmN [Corallococcus exiguus]NNB94760.1 23S rRNA (adenine(2503)-C(2))-methyltransferase RlmN [Corallococcus exiguus]NNC01720.1 23S rRNA (adenine(2503)-C(2))-methyltransferase RlmN [Corallococcus exiguus]NNC16883.1 23S rRNA (adenine(2503)-C(2))-methyltransferase RlmN [
MSEPTATALPVTEPLPVSAPAKLVDVASLSREKLALFLSEQLGERPFRAAQLYRWLHQRGATSFEEMTDLSKVLREKLKVKAEIVPLVKDLEQRSVDGTIKYRFKTRDGRFIESVYMPAEDRKTLCVSTQVGCAMACTFCMTGTLGLKRNLTAGEIVAQVHAVNREVRRNEGLETLRPLTNLVFMGMGEPLHNFENLKTALAILQSEEGPNFSHRHITVSTVGLVPMIERFGQETDVKLAISLNASTDEQRSQTMPVNRKWNIQALLDACRKFPLRQGRRITFEYVLLKGFNDTDDDAHRLKELLRDIPAKVNLIPYNENPGLGFQTTGEQRAEEFRAILAEAHVAAYIRKNRGRDIAGACGQLANRDETAAEAPT